VGVVATDGDRSLGLEAASFDRATGEARRASALWFS
jgi:hypothetical protein